MEKKIDYCGYGSSSKFRFQQDYVLTASCEQHDKNYEEGGDRNDRLKADVGFLWRMLSDCNKIVGYWDKKKALYTALLYFILVRIGGFKTFNYKE